MSTHVLQPRTELRLETSGDKTVHISLQSGTAEVFGTPLRPGERLDISGHSLAVYTWEGATILVDGEPGVVYTAEETPVVTYFNTHHVLHNLRTKASAAGGQGPRVLVAGPADSGKSTLCRMLLNWAVRGGCQPTFVDLDIGQGGVAPPGCIAATPVETPIDIEEGYPMAVPLVYYFGHVSASEAPEAYRTLVERLAGVLERRAESSLPVAAAGMVINTMGWIESLGYELLLHAIKTLQVDVVLVMDQDRLYSQLSSALKDEQGSMRQPISLVKLPKSGGVVTRDPAMRKDARTGRVREYFYGVQTTLHPHSQTVPAEKLQVFRIGGGFRAPSSALPMGATSKADPLKITPVSVAMDTLHSLLAVSRAETPDQLLNSNVAGFVLVTDMDVTQGTVTYLAPSAGPLPGRYLLTGTIKVFLT